MSTLSSLVLTSSSTVTLDFIAPLCEKKKPLNEKKQMLCIRIFIAVFIVISAVIAIMQYKNKNMLIAQMMGVSWGALAGAFLAPFLYGLYWKKTTKAGVVASFVFGVGLEIVQLLISMKVFSVANIPVLSFVFRNSLFSGVFAMVGGLILVPVVSLLTQKTVPANTDEIFSCYERKALVTVTDSLGEEKE
jgi:SSS family solute:Na+ symporter